MYAKSRILEKLFNIIDQMNDPQCLPKLSPTFFYVTVKFF